MNSLLTLSYLFIRLTFPFLDTSSIYPPNLLLTGELCPYR
jgi:hypothetical protein